MTAQFARAPHQTKPGPGHQMPHAALLIDFDNVTMGIRSDITKELKNLFNSDVIKGKVAVQRAYADWRRYPQYVVPLAEASVDLIFAPAYGSSKKNATDIRLSIDALELVFTRPEIGTFILLSGDSDFSSLVLKLKEYGKYVVGVGIRESASDLLVQNCDEYYSYSALTGLTRAGTDGPSVTRDPWELVERAVQQMVSDNDVMRSDRLKQVLLELDPNFDEKTLGFSKFNRFVSEAANRGVIRLQKLENGQFEIALRDASLDSTQERPARPPARSRSGRGSRSGRPAAGSVAPSSGEGRPPDEPEAPRPPRRDDGAGREGMESIRSAYELLLRASSELGASDDRAVRDSDIKRRMLDIQPNWDESSLGFSKFSRFLRQAHDAEVINLRKIENGSYEVALPPGSVAAGEAAGEKEPRRRTDSDRRGRRGSREPRAAATDPAAQTARPAARSEPGPAAKPRAVVPTPARPVTPAAGPPVPASPSKPAIGLRRGTRGSKLQAPPPLLEGQAVPVTRLTAGVEKPAAEAGSIASLGLPTEREEVIAYLMKSTRGIGRKTAESLVDAVGVGRVFETLHESPDRVQELIGAKRGEALVEAWRADHAARTSKKGGPGPDNAAAAGAGRRSGRRRGGRGRKRAPAGG